MIDPATAAMYAVVAVCLVLVGAILTTGVLGVAERGTILAGIFGALAYIAWRGRWRGES